MNLIEQARAFAEHAHANQKRKYDGADYVTHCEAVVAILHGAGIKDEVTLAAAWLHDVVEDTEVTDADLVREFDIEVAGIVWWLTDCDATRGNRRTRKQLDRERLALAPAKAQTIKVADLIDNTTSIVEHDPDFAIIYMKEKALLLPLLERADEGLRRRAIEILVAYENKVVQNWLKDRPHA